MELIAVLLMLGAGVALAVIILAAVAASGRPSAAAPVTAPRQDALAASLLFHVARAGTASDAEALRLVRRIGRVAAPVTGGIDVANWGEAYARLAGAPQRTALLDTAVQLAVAGGRVLTLSQYAALLDLSFSLGFQTDALARLREIHRFDYTGSASSRGADAPLYVRTDEVGSLLSVLGLTAPVTRREISASYRKLVAVHHPDRFHAAAEADRTAAAARFIEITRAYEALLQIYRD